MPTDLNETRIKPDTYLLVLLWLIVTAYNLLKPYHIDDTAYLEIAKWIAGHPGHPMSGMLNWGGMAERISQVNQPHLYFYLMAIWGGLFGYSEPSMHFLQSAASLVCIFAFYRLAKVFANEMAVWLTALLVLGPAFIVEQNLMVDAPMLALWLLFFNFLILHSSNQNLRYSIAGLACAAAVLIKYSGLVLILFLSLSLLIERRWKQLWVLMIPITALGAWSLFNYFDYGSIHIATRPESFVTSKLRPIRFLISWIVTLGGITPLGLIALCQISPRQIKWQKAIYAATFTALIALAICASGGWLSDTWSFRLLWFAFAINGCLTLACLVPVTLAFTPQKIWNANLTPDLLPYIYLVAWIVVVSVFYVLKSPFIAARHVLLILPPLLLIAAHQWKASLTSTSKVFALALTIVVSAGLCVSDWHFASFYKTEAADLMHTLPRTGTIWASGHWGWQWYSELEGMHQVDVEKSQLRPGDLLAVAQVVDHQELVTPPPMHLIRSDSEGLSLYELFCTGRSTGFYAYVKWGIPWSLSRTCQNRIDVFAIDAK